MFFLYPISMFGDIHLNSFKWNLRQNDNSKPMYVGTKSSVFLFYHLFIGINQFIYFKQTLYLKRYRFQRYNFCVNLYILWEILCKEIRRWIFTKFIGMVCYLFSRNYFSKYILYKPPKIKVDEDGSQRSKDWKTAANKCYQSQCFKMSS